MVFRYLLFFLKLF